MTPFNAPRIISKQAHKPPQHSPEVKTIPIVPYRWKELLVRDSRGEYTDNTHKAGSIANMQGVFIGPFSGINKRTSQPLKIPRKRPA